MEGRKKGRKRAFIPNVLYDLDFYSGTILENHRLTT